MADFVLKRPLFFACTVATAACFAFSYLTPLAMLTVCFVLLFAISFMFPFKCKLIKPAFIALVLCVLMALSSSVRYYSIFVPANEYNGTIATVKGVVTSVDGDNVVIKCDSISINDKQESVRFKISINHDSSLQLFPSSVVTADVAFGKEVYRNTSNGVVLYGKATDISADKNFEPTSLRYILYKARTALMGKLPFKNDDTAAFVKAMLFGDKSDVSGRLINKMNTLGVSHFIAVSGLHLVFAVVLFDIILGLLYIGYRPRACVAILSILFFTVLSGFSVSCIRAAIMMTVYYIGRVIGKIPDSLTSLSVASFFILVLCPYNVASLSFILSALATFGIIVLMPCFNSLIAVKFKSRILNGIYYAITSIFTMSLSATLMTLPVTVYYFDRVCIISPIVNVVLSIFMQAVFYIGGLAIVFSFVPFLTPVFAFLGDTVYNIIDLIVTKIYNIENITVGGGYRYFYLIITLLLVLVIGVYILYKKKMNGIFTLWYISGYASFCIVMFCINAFITSGNVDVSFVDVGQGSCTVISYGEKATLIDCGGNDYSEIARTFANLSVKYIDTIALTHVDTDHVQYLYQIVDAYDVDKVLIPHFSKIDKIEDVLKRVQSCGTEVVYVEKDSDISLCKGARLKVFVEKAEPVKHTENLSAVYMLIAYDKSVLFTGDMNIYQEYSYLDYGDEMDTDVLLVAHHGSKMSSHPQFIELCSPQYSVISVARDNNLNLPSSAVVERLKKVSAVLSTAELSTIKFRYNKKGYKLVK